MKKIFISIVLIGLLIASTHISTVENSIPILDFSIINAINIEESDEIRSVF